MDTIRKLNRSMEVDQIAELLELEFGYVEQILTFLKEYPEENNKEVALRLIAEERVKVSAQEDSMTDEE